MIKLNLAEQDIQIIFNALAGRPFAEVEPVVVNLRSQVSQAVAAKEKEVKSTPKRKSNPGARKGGK